MGDKRKYTRKRVEVQILANNSLHGTLLDISLKGCRLAILSKPFTKGDNLSVILFYRNKLIELELTICYVRGIQYGCKINTLSDFTSWVRLLETSPKLQAI